MTRSDLILCSIAAREGLVTSTQLAQAVLEDSPGDGASLAERLERIGALTAEQRASLEEQAPPRVSLKRILKEAGLELRGAELVDSLPTEQQPPAQAAR